jgi:transcription elongation GreA/GreB family factor
MLGKQVGDVIKVSTPAGDEQYEIVEVSYQAAEEDSSKPA